MSHKTITYLIQIQDQSAPPSPEEVSVKKRRPRRVDDDFVHVEKS